jgi:cell division septal protein FtsQ
VRSVRAIPSFPHSLRIEVTEQLPVAALTIDGARTAVAADGVVLGPALLSSSLPALNGADVSSHLWDSI